MSKSVFDWCDIGNSTGIIYLHFLGISESFIFVFCSLYWKVQVRFLKLLVGTKDLNNGIYPLVFTVEFFFGITQLLLKSINTFFFCFPVCFFCMFPCSLLLFVRPYLEIIWMTLLQASMKEIFYLHLDGLIVLSAVESINHTEVTVLC